jgi:hypothetical protein
VILPVGALEVDPEKLIEACDVVDMKGWAQQMVDVHDLRDRQAVQHSGAAIEQ